MCIRTYIMMLHTVKTQKVVIPTRYFKPDIILPAQGIVRTENTVLCIDVHVARLINNVAFVLLQKCYFVMRKQRNWFTYRRSRVKVR